MACCHQYWTRKKLRFQMRVHRFFVTKYRRNVFAKEGVDDLRVILANVCVDFESELIEFDGEDDPVHLLVNDPPKVSISKLVNSLKGASSLLIRKKVIRISRKNVGGTPYGHPVILPVVVAAHRLQLFANTSSNNERQTENRDTPCPRYSSPS